MYNRFLFSLRRIGEGQGQTEIAKEAKRNEGRGKEKRSKGQIRRSKSQNGKGKGQSKEGEGQRKNMDFRMEKPPIGKTFFANEKNKCAKNTIVTRKIR